MHNNRYPVMLSNDYDLHHDGVRSTFNGISHVLALHVNLVLMLGL